MPVNRGSPLVGYAGVVHMPLRTLIEDYLLPSNRTHGAAPRHGAPLDEETRSEVRVVPWAAWWRRTVCNAFADCIKCSSRLMTDD